MTKEITAVYLKITNVKNQFGGMDYHGLDVATFGTVVAGSPLYTEDASTCYMIYNATDFAIPDDPNITLTTEAEYKAFKAELDSKKPSISQEDKIKQLEEIVQTLILEKEGL
ncbi:MULTISPECIES: hypothetical protein [unclassified Lysinibacillus]|uniref:hypothetical protein n=1 Tax=unclassified Lysinibacillus TaxID=2636778 RepID=UPI0008832C11|nr:MULTISPECIES: hypothetical protein [unclassified Lysinibacillus]SCY98889.1 hypothetical protein SAMN02787078_03429 [Lysinibacillus sp. SG9]SDB47193.1 hypothetical protein SAMN02787079_03634 [Lysinibacillus sp. TC-37]SFT12199.1 hypothetical protein SAMN02787087_03731 [Lysinibacillus sp. SG55]